MPAQDTTLRGLGASDTRVHEAWYLAWYRIYVVGPRDVIRGKMVVEQARAHRASLLKRPRF